MGSFSGWTGDERSSGRRPPRLGLDHDPRAGTAVAFQPVVGPRRPIGQHVRFPGRGVLGCHRIRCDPRVGAAPHRAQTGRPVGRRLRGDHRVGTPGSTGQPARGVGPVGRHGARCGCTATETAPGSAAPRGPGRVSIKTRSTNGMLELAVVDNGPGIEAGHTTRIFEPFYSRRANGQGTGLGLFIVQTIVRGLRGTIRVSSWPGEGAAFIVEVPIHEPQGGTPDRG